MATKIYFRNVASDVGSGEQETRLNGTAPTGWGVLSLSTTAGAAAGSWGVTTVAGPTNGLEVTSGNVPRIWYSPPLDADATISGAITWNLRAAESSNSANSSINAQLEVVDGATGAVTLIDKTARTTELGTSEAAANFSETPASGVLCKRGDRLRVRVFADDAAANMGSGFTVTFWFNGASGATGDSYFTLTENLTFVSEPAGTQIFPTDTASAVSTASVDREAWTSRGGGVQTDVTNTVTGWTAPVQVTDTAGGTVVDWFTRPLTAFTLGGAVRLNIRSATSNTSATAGVRCEIAQVAGDGTSPVVWGVANFLFKSGGGTESAQSWLLAGDDLAITDGQRLRIRFYIDDANTSASTGPMVSGFTHTLYYAGTSGGASGDTYLTFTQTLTEYVSVTYQEATAAISASAAITLATAQVVKEAAASISGSATITTATATGPVTVVIACGAEATSEFGHWGESSASDGARTKDTTHVRSGTYAAKITNGAYIGQTYPASTRTTVHRFAVWIASTPATDIRLLEIRIPSQRHLIWLSANGKVELAGTMSTNVFPLDQWVLIDIYANSTANPTTVNWKINGVAQTQITFAVAAADQTWILYGTQAGVTATRWFDDIALSYTGADYPIPDGSVTWTGSAEVWTPAVAVTYHEAAAAITATATITAAGAQRVAGVASSITGTATITLATGQRVAGVAATVSGAATVALATAVRVAGVAAAVSGAATITAAGAQRVAGVASTISGAATVTAGATNSQAAAASITGTATVAPTAQRMAEVTAAISGIATITGDATITVGAVTHEAAASISGTATVSADGQRLAGVATTITASATVAANASQQHGAAAAVLGSATVAPAASRVAGVATAVTGAATVTLATATARLATASSIAGAATVSAAASQRTVVAAAISGSATVTGAVSASQAVAAAITSTATVAAGAQRVAQATTAITGTTTVTAGATALYAVAAAVSGVATQSATASVLGAPVVHDALGPISGAATVSGTVTAKVAAATVVTGLATVSGGASLARPLASSVTGTATVSSNATAKRAASASVTGVATVSVAAQNTKPVTAAITGTATVSGTIYLAGGARAAVSASAVVSADATAYLRVLGALQGIATVSGTLERLGGLAASVNGVATVVGTIVNTLPQPFPPGFGISVGLVPIGGAVVGMVPLPQGEIYLEPIGTAVVGLPAEEATVILEPLAPVEVGMA